MTVKALNIYINKAGCPYAAKGSLLLIKSGSSLHTINKGSLHVTSRGNLSINTGSITIYMCLTLCVLISLVFACINSTRTAAGRAAALCAADEGLFSLFSNYDRILYEKYGLLFLDGGYGSDSLKMGNIVSEVIDYSEKVLSPETLLSGITPEKLYDIYIESADVTGYVLATDTGYAHLVEQIKEVILLKLGADGLIALQDSVNAQLDAADQYALESEEEIDELSQKYEDQKELSEQLQKEMEENESISSGSEAAPEESVSEVEIPADFKNPIENITRLRELGLMAFALPEGAELSGASIDLNDTTSRRKLNSGMGLLPENEENMLDKIAVGEFAIRFFSNFVSSGSSDGLIYQTEYVVGGRPGDTANLSTVMNRLLLIRMGFNYIHLFLSAEKTAQIYEIATIISAILLMPQAVDIIAQVARGLWAYAESMMDIKSLLSGGKVPMFKDESTWQVSLSLFSAMNAQTKPESSKNGLSYQDYLRLLIFMLPEDEIVARTADMIEYNRRQADKENDFYLDLCLSTFQIEFNTHISGSKVTVNRSYSYNA